MTATGTDEVTGHPTYTIPDHKRDDGETCLWSRCTTLRADGWCPERCASIAPAGGQAGGQGV
jgi:hypothetical protein